MLISAKPRALGQATIPCMYLTPARMAYYVSCMLKMLKHNNNMCTTYSCSPRVGVCTNVMSSQTVTFNVTVDVTECREELLAGPRE